MYGIQTHFKGNITFKNLLVSPKDTTEHKSGAVYWFESGEPACDKEYIRNTSRTFGERFKEYLKEPSPKHNYSNNTGHTTTQENFQIIGRGTMALPELLKNQYILEVTTPHLIEI